MLNEDDQIVLWQTLCVSLFHGISSLHQWRRGLPCFIERFGRRGAQAAPIWDASGLVVVVPGHWPAAQNVLKGPKDRAWVRWGWGGQEKHKTREKFRDGVKDAEKNRFEILKSSWLNTFSYVPISNNFFIHKAFFLNIRSLKSVSSKAGKKSNSSDESHRIPPSHAVQLGFAGGEWMRKFLLANTSLYLGFSTRRRISASRRCRKPGSMAVPPITTRFSESTLRVSMGHWAQINKHSTA